VICIHDPIRQEAFPVINSLKRAGISKVVMMTGDSERTARAVAAQIGVSVKREPGKRSGSLFLMKILCIAKRVTGNGVNNSHSVNILRIMRHTSCICSGNMVVYKK
ncbi:MAG: HAD family hydrolase, partial [Oliverpabstia intestinalis]